jgi:methylglutaconyl-CoA hydratase
MSNVIVTTEDSLRFITLNRPEKRNALNDELIAELKAALREADAADDLRAIVIRGAGSDFCSGADLSALQKISESSALENLADATNLMELFLLMRQVKIPVIAAVHGRALAGGCGLATSCDLVLAANSARFGYPEVKIGFVPAMVAAILRRNLSEKKTFELITQGFEFSADEALEMDLINRVFADESFENEVKEYASIYLKVSRSAVILSKKLMYSIDGKDLTTSMQMGAEINTIARQTDDCKKGIAKFLQK